MSSLVAIILEGARIEEGVLRRPLAREAWSADIKFFSRYPFWPQAIGNRKTVDQIFVARARGGRTLDRKENRKFIVN